jgi:D-3-phosphoglycerate dehydrogenase
VQHEIYVSDPIDPDVLAHMRAAATVHLGYGPEAVAYLDVAATVDGVLLRAETFTREMIEASPRLRIIARHGVGTDNVDIDAATERGAWVTTTPGSNSNAVAEHVFALLLSAARHVPLAMDRVHSGKWSEGKGDLTGFELEGRTIGILGFGAIGRRVAAIAGGFGMRVIVSDPVVTEESVSSAGGRLVDLSTLVEEADVLTVHVPLLPSTRHVIGREEIAAMKPDAFVINTSRGGLVDEAALIDALARGSIGGVALDVLEAESGDMRDPLSHPSSPVADIPGLTVTPHIAGQTQESLRNAGARAWDAIRAVLADEAPAHAVNAPAPVARRPDHR